MGNMLRQAQQMQQKMTRMQEELAQKEIEASSGGGMVVCRVSGKQEILSLKISPEVVDPKEVEMLEDLVKAAVGEAIRKSQELVTAEMNKITGGMGLNLPKMF
ncbi:YbaB/EbfC family nucleoid-associated protein [bacterium]|nr:MAG: YbaB/EbfC family nucleoid-associated protein [bacterium]